MNLTTFKKIRHLNLQAAGHSRNVRCVDDSDDPPTVRFAHFDTCLTASLIRR